MKLYILTDRSFGDWESEFGVDGIFSSREDAERAAKELKHRLPRIVNSDKVNYDIIEARLGAVLDNKKLWTAKME